MEDANGKKFNREAVNHGLQLIRYPQYRNCCDSWFDLRVFYVRMSNFQVDDSTPESLSLDFIPLNHDTLLEVNGSRTRVYSDAVSSVLRRDRADKNNEEATFVSTDNVRLTGSVKFEVFHKEDLFLSGVLEMSNSNGFTGESKNCVDRWSMNCEPVVTARTGFLKGKQIAGAELRLLAIEVYVAGSFSGRPVILTKTLQLSFRKEQNAKVILDSNPEYETMESQKDVPSATDMPVSNDVGFVTASSDEGAKLGSNDVQKAAARKDEDLQIKNTASQTPVFNKRHRGCSYCILDIENNPIPEFPSNEEVVGVLTMEDVIEELLKEEILDETDEYVNIHNRIKVNMHASQGKASSLSLPLASPNCSNIISSLNPGSQLWASSDLAPNPMHPSVNGSSMTT